MIEVRVTIEEYVDPRLYNFGPVESVRVLQSAREAVHNALDAAERTDGLQHSLSDFVKFDVVDVNICDDEESV